MVTKIADEEWENLPPYSFFKITLKGMLNICWINCTNPLLHMHILLYAGRSLQSIDKRPFFIAIKRNSAIEIPLFNARAI